MVRNLAYGVLICMLAFGMLTGMSLAFAPSLDVVHEHQEHEYAPQHTIYDENSGIVWSLDAELEDQVSFVGYDPVSDEVVENEPFENGHGLAINDEHVYIAEGSTVWTYNTSSGEFNESFELLGAPAQIEYDADRDWLWAGGGEAVYAHNVSSGEDLFYHEAHTDGISSIALGDGVIASATTWDDEVIVYDIEEDEVAFEPDLGYDDSGVFSIHIDNSNQLFIGVHESIPVYDLDTQDQVDEFEGHVFGTLGILHLEDEGILASSGHDNRIGFQDIETGELLENHEYEGSIYGVSHDAERDLLWYGAGGGDEGEAVVRGIDIATTDEDDADDDPADGTDDSTDADDTDDGTDETDDADDGVDEGDDADDTMDTDDSDAVTDEDDEPEDADDADDDTDDGLPGFGLLPAIMAFLAIGAYSILRD